MANPKIPVAAIKISCDMVSEMRWTGVLLQSNFIWLGVGRLLKSCISYGRKSAVTFSSRRTVQSVGRRQ